MSGVRLNLSPTSWQGLCKASLCLAVQGWVGENTLNQRGKRGMCSSAEFASYLAGLGNSICGEGQRLGVWPSSCELNKKKHVHATAAGRPNWPRKEIQVPDFTRSECPSWEGSFGRNPEEPRRRPSSWSPAQGTAAGS